MIMKSTVFFLAAAATFVRALPVVQRQNIPSEADIRRLAPELGAVPNQEPIGTECLGPVQPDGQKKRIPCECPPEREEFLKQLVANVQAGRAIRNPSVRVSFPTGDSKEDKKARITAGTITLQNLKGPGVGCPNVSTTFSAQSKAIDAGTDALPAPVAASPAPSPSASSSAPPAAPTAPTASQSATSSAPPAQPTPSTPSTPPANNNDNSAVNGITREIVAKLAPELGSQPNNNPNKFGDCDGPNLNGKIAHVPCPCPPLRDAFITALTRDAQLGHAFNNPTVKVNFPLGDSIQDKKARITASIIALQNLDGPGKGCPGVSTTLSLQSAALDQGKDVPAPASSPASSPAPSSTLSSTLSSTTSPSTSPSTSPAPAPALVNNDNGKLTRDLVAKLAPELGAVPNQEPIGAECLGPVQPDGQKKRIPCACPPTREKFIDALFRDASLGHAANNPTVKVSFPTGDSVQDKKARLTAGTIALQNLDGPGKGCPNVSTTFAAQGAALN